LKKEKKQNIKAFGKTWTCLGFSTFHWVTKSCGKWNNQMKMKIKEKKNETIMEKPTMEERFEDYSSLQIKTNKIPKTT